MRAALVFSFRVGRVQRVFIVHANPIGIYRSIYFEYKFTAPVQATPLTYLLNHPVNAPFVSDAFCSTVRSILFTPVLNRCAASSRTSPIRVFPSVVYSGIRSSGLPAARGLLTCCCQMHGMNL